MEINHIFLTLEIVGGKCSALGSFHPRGKHPDTHCIE
jgi:hypothetical protein